MSFKKKIYIEITDNKIIFGETAESIALYSINGKKVAETKNSNHIAIEGLTNNTYIMVADINNKKCTIKVVLRK